MKVRSLVFALATIAALPAVAQKAPKNGYIINGQVQNAGGTVYLEEMTSATNYIRKDSAQIGANGKFTFTGKVAQPGLYRLLFLGNQAMLLPLENAAITVSGNLSDLTSTAASKGTKESEHLQKMRAIRSSTQAKTKQLNERFAKIQQIPDSVQAIIKEAQAMTEREAKDLKNLIRRNPSSLVGMYTALAVLSPQDHFEFLDSMAVVYKKKITNPTYANLLAEKTDKLRQTAVGGTAPEISLASPDGKVIPLSSLRGKYVLIDFWASWCGPCRKENPNVVRLYNQYKDKNFEIYGVSLDKDKDKWVKAIADDNLTWTHVSDLKFWQSQAAQLYNVNSIPATVLIDPQGKIIAKNLRGKELEDKVAQLLN